MSDTLTGTRTSDWREFIDETRFFRLILDHVSECFVAVDVEGRILHINEPYCELLNTSADQCVGRHITEVVSQDTRLHLVAQGAPPVIGGPLRVRGQQLFTRQVPVRFGGEIVGAVGMALFSDIQQAVSFAKSLGATTVSLDGSRAEWEARHSLEDIFGVCPSIDALREAIRGAARTNFNVLIRGETGTGKELVASALHSSSSRAGGPFVPVNCGSIPAELVESELFGYERGAFTGAAPKGKRGKVEIADGGTLFLDEIGDLPLSSQAALLRFIETGELQPLGAQKPKAVDVRLVCATHHDLHRLAADGRFRTDLLYRLDVVRLEVPSLRERTDILELAEHILQRVTDKLPDGSRSDAVRLAPSALAELVCSDWPGNVRELRNVLERAIAYLPDDEVEIRNLAGLSYGSGGTRNEENLQVIVREAERKAIERAMILCGGNKQAAARHLGIDRTTLYKKLRNNGMV